MEQREKNRKSGFNIFNSNDNTQIKALNTYGMSPKKGSSDIYDQKYLLKRPEYFLYGDE